MGRAIVTGGAGFIGSHMVDLLLAKGDEVVIIDDFTVGSYRNLEQITDKDKIQIVEQDITAIGEEPAYFQNVETVFHFAGIGDIVPSISNPTRYSEINILGTVKVVEAARKAGVRNFIYAASSSCYGLADTPTDEDHPIDLQHPYALSKYLGEQVALNWAKFYKMNINSIRIFNAYGLRSKTSGAYGAVMGVFLKQKLENRALTVVGVGTQTRDFLNAKDVARAFYAVSQVDLSGEIFNLGAGKPVSVNKLVEILDSDFINIPWRPGEPECTWANIQKIQTITGWLPSISFEQGVKEMLENIDYWREAPLWDQESIREATSDWYKFLG